MPNKSTRVCPICDEVKHEGEYYKMDWMCKECKRNKNKENYQRRKHESTQKENTIEELTQKVMSLELCLEVVMSELKQIKKEQSKAFKQVEKNLVELSDGNRKEIKKLTKKVVSKELDKLRDGQ